MGPRGLIFVMSVLPCFEYGCGRVFCICSLLGYKLSLLWDFDRRKENRYKMGTPYKIEITKGGVVQTSLFNSAHFAQF